MDGWFWCTSYILSITHENKHSYLICQPATCVRHSPHLLQAHLHLALSEKLRPADHLQLLICSLAFACIQLRGTEGSCRSGCSCLWPLTYSSPVVSGHILYRRLQVWSCRPSLIANSFMLSPLVIRKAIFVFF